MRLLRRARSSPPGRRRAHPGALLLAAAAGACALLAGCGIGEGVREDTIAGVTSGARAESVDTIAAATPDSARERAAPRDADHAFLRELVDHHDAMVAMGGDAMSRGAAARTRADGHRLHTALEAQRDSLIALVRSLYGEELHARQAEEYRQALAALRRLSGPEHDRAFYQAAIAHQLAGAELVEQRISLLRRPEVRRLAERAGDQHRTRAEELERSSRAP